jgi:glycosyltransferase involved in cell wall biosynthesis
MNIEVAIPCYNEQATISKVVRDFRAALPGQEIVVYDNNSTDRTAEFALQAGARVVRVNRRGKGVVVQAIFETSPADIVVIVDGDDTYEAADIELLVAPVRSGEADMVIGTRLHNRPAEFHPLHHFGNRLLTGTLNKLYGTAHQDILSGYRAFSRRFIERVPLISTGFEIETELLIQTHEYNLAVKEIPIRFRNRPPDSLSKLNSIRDGYRILLTMVTLLRDHRPLLTFGVAAAVTFLLGITLWLVGFVHRGEQHLFSVSRNLGVVLIEVSLALLLSGLVLNTINTRVRELTSLLRRNQSQGRRRDR